MINPEILQLREIMQRVRTTREKAGLILDFAKYDIETQEHNNQFVGGFRDMLSIRTEGSTRYPATG